MMFLSSANRSTPVWFASTSFASPLTVREMVFCAMGIVLVYLGPRYKVQTWTTDYRYTT